MACIGRIINRLPAGKAEATRKMMNYPDTENVYNELLKRKNEWCTLQKWPAQDAASDESRWKEYETIAL